MDFVLWNWTQAQTINRKLEICELDFHTLIYSRRRVAPFNRLLEMRSSVDQVCRMTRGWAEELNMKIKLGTQ